MILGLKWWVLFITSAVSYIMYFVAFGSDTDSVIGVAFGMVGGLALVLGIIASIKKIINLAKRKK